MRVHSSAVRPGRPERPGGVDKAWEAHGGVSPGSHAEQDRHFRGEVRLRRRGKEGEARCAVSLGSYFEVLRMIAFFVDPDYLLLNFTFYQPTSINI